MRVVAWLDFESSVKNGVLGLGELIVWPQAFNTSNMKSCMLVLKTRMKHEWFRVCFDRDIQA